MEIGCVICVLVALALFAYYGISSARVYAEAERENKKNKADYKQLQAEWLAGDQSETIPPPPNIIVPD